MKRVIWVGILLVAAAAVFGACDQDEADPDRMMDRGRGMMSGDMMEEMMRDPEMMRQMMDMMMADTTMMRQMMADPRVIEMMAEQMAVHPEMMGRHMEAMMQDEEHRRAMIEVLHRNPAMREQMRTILEEAERSPAP